VTKVQKALRCQKAEHTFADTPCGIMDQYISSMGKADHLLLIDCRYARTPNSQLYKSGHDRNDIRSHAYELVKLSSSEADHPVLVVTNSMVKHNLGASAYPERVAQCKEAVKTIAKKYPAVKALRDVTLEMLREFKDVMSPVVFKRALHAVSEDCRTVATVKCTLAAL
jgi:galactokinase